MNRRKPPWGAKTAWSIAIAALPFVVTMFIGAMLPDFGLWFGSVVVVVVLTMAALSVVAVAEWRRGW